VRYLLTREEEKEYRALPDEAARTRFIENFWARRDEDPSTPANEFELRFWNRVADAERMFRDAPYPGWKTDRGKVFVLLGPPDEIRQGMTVADVPYAFWIYHQPRFEGMERDTEVRFIRDKSGEMEITDKLFASRLERLSGATKNIAIRAGAAMQAPEPKEILDVIAQARPPMDAGRFHTHYDFFLAADGSTSVVLTLGIRRDATVAPKGGAVPQTAPSGSWKVYARLTGASGSYDLVRPDSFRSTDFAADVDGFLLYQGRVSAPPGIYSVFYGIQDPASGELFSLGDRVHVPDFAGGGFSLSSITLAARLQPEEHPSEGAPFLMGRMTVVPKMEARFENGQDLAYYFQVYHPQPDPGTGQAVLDLTYQFFRAESLRKTGEPDFTAFGKPLTFPNQSGQVHGYAFALAGWPPGEYKVRVEVKDRIAGRAVESEARFSVK
jgi:GWxTD domain-containing protein